MEQNHHLARLLRTALAEIGITLHEIQVKQFMLYLEQLQSWNRLVNLTGLKTDKDIIIKHFVDSLVALKVEELRHHATLLDIGTGPGFPGIPLRIAREDLNITLIEPTEKKISFLYLIVGLLKLDRVRIFHGTLEQFLADGTANQRFDYVTTRALKPDMMLRYGAQLLAGGGRLILYLSRPILSPEFEKKKWTLFKEYRLELPQGSGRRVVSMLTEVRESAQAVPRGTAVPSC
jgi:16S rRNA (guanine527-N7)-methyltransferase